MNVLGNALIGLALVLSFMGGFLSVGSLADLFDQKNIAFYLVLWAFGTVITLTKDLKDIDGDAVHKVSNIYSIFGRANGKNIVLALLFMVMVLPFVFIHHVPRMLVVILLAVWTCYLYYKRENERIVYIMAAIEGTFLFVCLYF